VSKDIIFILCNRLEEYKKLHTEPWPEIIQNIKNANIQNYSIFYVDGYLISYLEYTGNDFEADMKKKNNLPITKEWRKLTTSCLIKLDQAKEDEWDTPIEEVFHVD
jgi:L-rhamnose mutarotase